MDTTITTKTTAGIQYSPLLRLPGEIRNRIYDFLNPSTTDNVTVLLWPRTDYGLPVVDMNWAKLQRDYLGATQACRQLRTEFRPMCEAKFQYYVPIGDLEKFMNMFPDQIKNSSRATHKVLIELAPAYRCRIDIVPLIKLYRTANATSSVLTIGFVPLGYEQLWQLLSAPNDTKWQRFIDEHVTGIMLQMLPWAFALDIMVRPNYYDTMVKRYGKLNVRTVDLMGRGRERAMVMREAWESSVGICVPDLRQFISIRKDSISGCPGWVTGTMI